MFQFNISDILPIWQNCGEIGGFAVVKEPTETTCSLIRKDLLIYWAVGNAATPVLVPIGVGVEVIVDGPDGRDERLAPGVGRNVQATRTPDPYVH
ncbi:hypothetical protein PG994_002970 [Apiospora phragmitis]|uniref:Uncharacterized protein n=1 Tax=Apiospora phragmitis TaxID=2905665 RepID=A0ABR1W6S6_9PEZI